MFKYCAFISVYWFIYLSFKLFIIGFKSVQQTFPKHQLFAGYCVAGMEYKSEYGKCCAL